MALMLTSCSELMILGGLGGTVVSQSPAVKAYNGIDIITIRQTEKSIKQHAYERIKHETKKLKPNE